MLALLPYRCSRSQQRTRLVALGGAVFLHSQIALVMNLFRFSWIMLGSELVILRNDDFRAGGRRLSAFGRGIDRLRQKLSDAARGNSTA